MQPADRDAAATLLQAARRRCDGVPAFNELMERSLTSAGMVGHSAAEIGALRERATGFLRAHADSARLTRQALGGLRAACPDTGAAPLEDLALLADVIAQEMVSSIQVARGEWLVGRLKTGDVSAFGILDDSLCYPLAALSSLNDLADVASAAMALAVRAPREAPERSLRILWKLHWGATYFVHFKVCNLPPGDVAVRVHRRLAQWPGYPQTTAGEAARTAVLRVWDMGIEGSGPRARRELPACIDAIERIASIVGGDAGPKNDLLARVNESAGGAGHRPARVH